MLRRNTNDTLIRSIDKIALRYLVSSHFYTFVFALSMNARFPLSLQTYVNSTHDLAALLKTRAQEDADLLPGVNPPAASFIKIVMLCYPHKKGSRTKHCAA